MGKLNERFVDLLSDTILTKLKEVDGIGSGLDADLFQGQPKSDFLLRVPDFDSGWFIVNQQGAVINNPLGKNAYFLGFQKHDNGAIVQFGIFSSYQDDDVNGHNSGMFLYFTENEIVIPVYTKNNDYSRYIAGWEDGISHSLPLTQSISVKVVGWKLADGIID